VADDPGTPTFLTSIPDRLVSTTTQTERRDSGRNVDDRLAPFPVSVGFPAISHPESRALNRVMDGCSRSPEATRDRSRSDPCSIVQWCQVEPDDLLANRVRQRSRHLNILPAETADLRDGEEEGGDAVIRILWHSNAAHAGT